MRVSCFRLSVMCVCAFISMHMHTCVCVFMCGLHADACMSAYVCVCAHVCCQKMKERERVLLVLRVLQRKEGQSVDSIIRASPSSASVSVCVWRRRPNAVSLQIFTLAFPARRRCHVSRMKRELRMRGRLSRTTEGREGDPLQEGENSREWDRQCQARYRKPKEDWTTELEKEGEKCGTLSVCLCRSVCVWEGRGWFVCVRACKYTQVEID